MYPSAFSAASAVRYGGKILKTVLSLLLILLILFIWKGERFLVVDDDAQCRYADGVVVLGGSEDEDRPRVLEGAALIQRKRAQYLVLPLRHKALRWFWLAKRYGIRSHIPESRIFIGRMESSDKALNARFGGTFTEASKTIQIMLDNDMESAIIVSSAYHMRRAKLAFEIAQENHRLKFYYHPVRKSFYDSRHWWLDKKYLFKVLKEYKKLIGTLVVYKLGTQSHFAKF